MITPEQAEHLKKLIDEKDRANAAYKEFAEKLCNELNSKIPPGDYAEVVEQGVHILFIHTLYHGKVMIRRRG